MLVYFLNNQIKNIRPIFKSFITTFVAYTFLVFLQSLLSQLFIEPIFSFKYLVETSALFLLYGYVLCVVVSLLVYFFYWIMVQYYQNDD